MPITEAQRARRRGHIGSSDAAAIIGRDPWRTPADVYWSKVAPTHDAEPNEAMQTGNRLEGPLLSFAAERLGVRLRRNQYRVSAGPDGGVCSANFDALIIDRPEAVEAKYVGPNSAAAWGDEWTDDVPEHVLVQCLHQCYVGQLNCVWVAAAIAGYSSLAWRMYCVRRDEEIIAALIAREIKFWKDHVLRRVPPESFPSIDILKRLRREPQSTCELPSLAADKVAEYQTAKAAEKAAGEAAEAIKRELIAMLGTCEAGILPDGRQITYLLRKGRRTCDVDRLRVEYPAAYETCVTQQESRVFLIKEPKQHGKSAERNEGEAGGGTNAC